MGDRVWSAVQLPVAVQTSVFVQHGTFGAAACARTRVDIGAAISPGAPLRLELLQPAGFRGPAQLPWNASSVSLGVSRASFRSWLWSSSLSSTNGFGQLVREGHSLTSGIGRDFQAFRN